MSFFHSAFYTCQEASHIIVKSSDFKLSALQRFKLWVHLQVCVACKRFKIQNDWIDKKLHKLSQQPNHFNLSKEQKEVISTRFKKETKT